MRYLGAQSNAKDLVAQEQLSALISNPMTSIRDLIVGGVGGAPTRLPGPTSEGLVLTRVGNALAWAIATGFANPMTADGDMIIGGTNGAAARLAGGSAGQVLTMVSGAPAWVTPSGGGGGDFKKDGSVQMTGGLNEAPRIRLGTRDDGVLDVTNVAANVIDVMYTNGTGFSSLGPGIPGMRRTIMRSGRNSGNVPGQDTAPITIVHNRDALDLITKANITCLPGDSMEFECLATGLWAMLRYDKGDGTSLVASAGFTEAQVRDTPLTGLVTSTSGQIVPTDKLLAALGKLQAQLNGSVFRMETIATSTAGQTSYAVPNGYTAGQIQVWFNGVLLQPSEYTATDGANVVLQTGAISTSDVMQVGVLGSLRTQDDALLQYTVANLPSASANAFKQRWCTNMAGGAGVVVSNGTNWVRVADNTVVTV
jgi:hypothetical protein